MRPVTMYIAPNLGLHSSDTMCLGNV